MGHWLGNTRILLYQEVDSRGGYSDPQMKKNIMYIIAQMYQTYLTFFFVNGTESNASHFIVIKEDCFIFSRDHNPLGHFNWIKQG